MKTISLILALKERFPDLVLTDPISPEGEALETSPGRIPGFFPDQA